MKFTIVAILITCFIGTQAQITKKGTVSGKIIDQNHIAITGATIQLFGQDFSTQTDEQGNYLLKVPAGRYKLVATAIGHQRSEMQITVHGNRNVTASLVLEESSETLNNVAVLGLKVKTATATRSLLPIQDIPQSIAVIGQRVIKQQGAI
jgi:iron complex outermembrane receptor protein